jgi:hypothetical protein
LSLGLSSCTRLLGWGVLLWSSELPAIPSGTVLPVYIRSNIDQVWVVGIPEEFRPPGAQMDKFEIPLARLELAGSRQAALRQAADFADYALTYAETLQDGLPIRREPDNGAQRVYRLRLGEIIKVMSLAGGNPAISTTGEPLPGEWYRVFTENGIQGYCFSYRLRLFEHGGGALAAGPAGVEAALEDPVLETVLDKVWSPEIYGAMLESGHIDLEALSRLWRFAPGADSGLARIFTDGLDKTFSYTGIRAEGSQAASWRFDGTNLRMSLRAENTLAVQYADDNGAQKGLIFVSLAGDLGDIILQETERRRGLFENLYNNGPVFTSSNYGNLRLNRDGRFSWSGYGLLMPHIIPVSVLGSGTLAMDRYLDATLLDRFTGAFSLQFDGIGGPGAGAVFMYTLEAQGIRLEYAPPESVEGVTVLRRSSSPTVIYFSRAGD